MTKISDLHAKWLENSEYKTAYDALDDEFALAKALIEARLRAGLTQEQLAERLQTTQSSIARIEGGHVMPTTRTLKKIARATGSRLKISFEVETINSLDDQHKALI